MCLYVISTGKAEALAAPPEVLAVRPGPRALRPQLPGGVAGHYSRDRKKKQYCGPMFLYGYCIIYQIYRKMILMIVCVLAYFTCVYIHIYIYIYIYICTYIS